MCNYMRLCAIELSVILARCVMLYNMASLGYINYPTYSLSAQRGILSCGAFGIAKIDTPKDHQKRCNLKKCMVCCLV